MALLIKGLKYLPVNLILSMSAGMTSFYVLCCSVERCVVKEPMHRKRGRSIGCYHKQWSNPAFFKSSFYINGSASLSALPVVLLLTPAATCRYFASGSHGQYSNNVYSNTKSVNDNLNLKVSMSRCLVGWLQLKISNNEWTFLPGENLELFKIQDVNMVYWLMALFWRY